jgi:hypothetical protein
VTGGAIIQDGRGFIYFPKKRAAQSKRLKYDSVCEVYDCLSQYVHNNLCDNTITSVRISKICSGNIFCMDFFPVEASSSLNNVKGSRDGTAIFIRLKTTVAIIKTGLVRQQM